MLEPLASVEVDKEPEDVFSDSLESLYGYPPITYSSAGSLFRYKLTEDQLRLQSSHLCKQESVATSETLSPVITLLTPTTQANNWALHASSIWASSVFLAEHLDDLHIDQHIRTVKSRGQTRLRVLELGAGAGLPSILISRCFSDVDVIASDYPDEQLIRTMQSNMDRNGVAHQCRVVAYAWGEDTSAFIQESVVQDGYSMDVIIAADTLWNPESHGVFLKTLQFLLRKTKDARVYLIAGLHTGRYTLQRFLDSVEGYGFEVEDVVEREVSGCCQRGWSVDRAEGEEEKDRRKWVLWITIKWNSLHS